jgi:tRNA (guanine26-N2/guanine27-N2)-dimethyltransferase
MSTSDNCVSSSSGGKLAGEGGGGDADRAAVAAVIDVPDGHEVITEGQITMLYPKIENSVFYNPVQVQNRDLSVLMLGMYAERRTERMWTTRKRKEVRKKMMREEEENRAGAAAAAAAAADGNNGGGDARKETKEERRASLARFEVDLDARVADERSSIDFAKMTRESSHTVDGMSIFEALAASGLRSLRYWKEVPGVRTIVVNDLDPVAVDMARENIVRNGLADDMVGGREEWGGDVANANGCRHRSRPRGIKLQVGDATHEMYMARLPPRLQTNMCNPTQLEYQTPQYDVIDLDPYGSAAPFVDAALQSISDGGLLAVTCTDMAALGGSHPETCYGRYGAFPIQRAGYLQELALRILLYHISVVAGRYGRTIRPVLSVGMAFYCRVFVEVNDDKAGVSNRFFLFQFNFSLSCCILCHDWNRCLLILVLRIVTR